MGQTGCVSFMFDRKGVILIDGDGVDEDEITMDALEAGAEDIDIGEDCIELTTAPEDFHAVRDALEGKYTIDEAIELIKKNTRHYAKRQLTWLRRYDNIKWFNLSSYEDKAMAMGDILKWLRTNANR